MVNPRAVDSPVETIGSNAAGPRRRELFSLLKAICCSGLSVLASPLAADGQQSTVPTNTSCRSCRIDRTLLATLRDTGQKAFIGGRGQASIARDSKGRFYVVDADRSRVALFGANGLLLRTIGRVGGGPGEFSDIVRVNVTAGDTLRVYESQLGKESVFSPLHEFVRADIVPAGIESIVRLGDGRSVTNFVSGHRDLVGLPLHLLGKDGTIEGSFGSEDPVFRAGMQGMLKRRLGRR